MARILSKAQQQTGGGWVHLAIQALMAAGIDAIAKIKKHGGK